MAAVASPGDGITVTVHLITRAILGRIKCWSPNRVAATTPTPPFASFQATNALANSEDCLGLFQNDFCVAVLSGIVERLSFIAELDNLRSLCRCNFCCWQRRIDFLNILRML